MTLTKNNISDAKCEFDDDNKDGQLKFVFRSITCPNPQCREYVLDGGLYHGKDAGGGFFNYDKQPFMYWKLRPQSSARPFPSYIPAPLRQDYEEACAIRDLSPKASATLSRRCLQGMIRDFWGVKEATLHAEINAIQGKVDAAIFGAIDAVRKIGNIGAHMEKDINLVIDVDPHEAQALIQLTEVLFQEWYIARKQREDHLASIVEMADVKKAAKAAAAG
ncbi:DUF4145 domain-containing protein [Massilia sp. SR12]